MQQQPIQISKASNGWIVILPFDYMEQPAPDFTDPETIKKMARIMKTEFDSSKDPLLDKIEQENVITGEPDMFVHQTKRVQPNPVYIFKTYDEASTFIKLRFDN